MIRRLGVMVRPVAIVAIVAAVAWLTFQSLSLVESRQNAQDERADLRSQLATTQTELTRQQAEALTAATDAAALADQVESLGEEPVVQPDTPSTLPRSLLTPIPGARGPGPTFAQTLRAVQASIGAGLNEVCDGSCAGPPGSDSTVPRAHG